MLSMQLSNIPFYVLERQKCVNICPSRMIVGFSGFRQRILQGEGTNSGGLSWDPRRSYVYIFSVSHSSITGGQIHNFSWQNSEFGSQIIKHRYPQNRSKVNSELIPKIVCKNFGNWLSYFNVNVINFANIANRDIWWYFHQIWSYRLERICSLSFPFI